MLARSARLHRPADIATTSRTGRRGGSALLGVHVQLTDASPTPAMEIAVPAAPRVAVVVSRRVGPAVVRNTVRRRLRHVVAQRLATWPAGLRLVVRARPSAAGASSAQLAAALDTALLPLVPSRAR